MKYKMRKISNKYAFWSLEVVRSRTWKGLFLICVPFQSWIIMCLPGTESRGIINGHDPLITKLDTGGAHYNNEEEYMTMRSDRSEGVRSSSTSFIQNLRQRLQQQLPTTGLLRQLPLTEVLLFTQHLSPSLPSSFIHIQHWWTPLVR